jgi:hypothetical protein
VYKRDDIPIAVLWDVERNDHRLACRIYRQGSGMQLRIESATAVLVAESFEMQPRAVARARTVHAGLMRRGWRDAGRSENGSGDT